MFLLGVTRPPVKCSKFTKNFYFCSKIIAHRKTMSRRASSRVQTKAAKDEEKAKSLAAPFDLTWTDVDNYFYVLDTADKMEGTKKIAGFDMV